MFPWLWFWAPQFQPQVHLPLSGSVAQHIAPDWFFGAIPPAAGDGRVEQRAFEVASYGRQLGLITEALLDVAAQQPPATARGRAAVQRLKDIQHRIEAVKQLEQDDELGRIEAQVKAIRQAGGARSQQLEKKLRPLLGKA
jgi:hypothetical protein